MIHVHIPGVPVKSGTVDLNQYLAELKVKVIFVTLCQLDA